MYDLPKLTLDAVINRTADLHAARPAFSFVNGEAMTYEQFSRKMKDLMLVLEANGIRFGDKVVILSENKPTWGIAYFAIVSMGAVAVPVLPDFHADAVQHIIRHSEAKAAFVSEKLLNKVEDGNYEELSTIFSIEDFSIRPWQGATELRFRDAVTAIRERLTGRKERPTPQEDDLAAIVYTSGTTGHSKGVMLSHKNLVSNAISSSNVVVMTQYDRMLSLLPLAHTFECTLGMILPVFHGMSVTYLEKLPTPSALLPALQKVRPTFILSVPLVIEKIYKNRVVPSLTRNKVMRFLYSIGPVRSALHRLAGKKLMAMFGGELKFFGVGGAALAPDVEKFLREAKFPYAIGYGMTESSPVLAGTKPEDTHYRAIGPAVKDVEIRLDNMDPTTGEGEIVARGPNIMMGYYKAPTITEQTFTEDGWLKTGDLGYFGEDGYLYFKGRLKNVIVGSSGENIYPEEIEAVINEFDFILESLVYEHGKQLVARVHLSYEKLDELYQSSKHTETEMGNKVKELIEDLRKKVNSKMPSFSRIAKVFEQVEPFEKTPTQKIKRFLYVNNDKEEK